MTGVTGVLEGAAGTAKVLASNVWYVDDLVKRASAKDPVAFSELYSRYAPRIETYLAQRLNGHTTDAEDLTADVFTKVLERLDSYQSRGLPFSAWLFRVAHNRLIDHVRRAPRQATEPLDEALDVPEWGSSRELNLNLTSDQLRSELQLLTPEQREVVKLRFLDGLSLLETAERTGRGEEAVKKLQARGLAALKRSMDCLSGCWRLPEQ